MNTTKPTYIVLGYGIPDNILEDKNYNTYLSLVFNTIYKDIITSETDCNLVLCGGNSDIVPPYARTEAGELAKWFQKLMALPELIPFSSHIHIVEENTSYSTLENMVNAKEVCKDMGDVTLFCEYTRKERVSVVAQNVLGPSFKEVIDIDFDVSPNRYMKPDLIAEKEQKSLMHDLWALKSPENLKRHHELYKGRIDFIRANPEARDILQTWWKEKLLEEWKYIERA